MKKFFLVFNEKSTKNENTVHILDYSLDSNVLIKKTIKFGQIIVKPN